jgi:hypothetical protein
MADSQREKIFDAIHDLLINVDGMRRIYRGKVDPLAMETPSAQIVPGFDQVAEEVGTLLTRDMQVFVVVYVSAQSEILSSLESFMAKVQLAMTADHKLGGVAIDISETAAADVFPANALETVAGVILEYQVLYRVSRTNPYGQA